MKTQQELHSGWKLTWTEPMHGIARRSHNPARKGTWLDATVPGDAHLDLMRAGIIPDPFYGDDAEHCIWMEEKDWWYSTTFAAPAAAAEQRVFLLFEGLDTLATIYLNGEEIGRHDNMFTPVRIDVTGRLQAGENELSVCLASLHYAEQVQLTPAVRGGFAPRRVFLRKAQSCFGWDILPRVVTVGIWRPVRLEVCDEAEIESVNVQTLELAGKKARVLVELDVRRHRPTAGPLAVGIALYGQERTIPLDPGGEGTLTCREVFELEDAPLWWPHNHGTPHLLNYQVTLSRGEEALDRREGMFGIRTVELVHGQAEGAGEFCFKINGKRVFLKGMNWTPFDAIYPRMNAERCGELIRIAKESHVNTFRVWGGGIYEAPYFYEQCDREGILVWQDFMFACAIYPQDDAFLARVREEAEVIVRQLRGHACLIAWCGDNEVDWTYTAWPDLDHTTNRINRECLPEVCARLDPRRPYVPSSPFSYQSRDPNDEQEGDMHLWYHGLAYSHDNYLKRKPLMVTEIGHLSMPDMEVIESFLPESARWPLENAQWRMHASDAPRMGWGESRLKSLYASIENNGLPRPNSLEEMIELTQRLQAEATRCWVEHCANLPNCWGIILWNLCDGWPQLSDAYIAYPFHPKPALATVREVFGRIDR